MFCFSVDQLCKCCYFGFLLAIEFPFFCCLLHISLNRTFYSTGESCGSDFVNVSRNIFGFRLLAHAMWGPRYSAASKAFVWFGAPSDCLLLVSCGFCTCTNNRRLLSMRCSGAHRSNIGSAFITPQNSRSLRS